MNTTDNNVLVLYHGGCFDGFCAAWVTTTYFQRQKVDFHPAFYGKEPPSCKGKYVYIVDFSYPRDVLKRIAAEALLVVVLDHHRSAEQALEGLEREWLLESGAANLRIIFDMERSGAQITWDYFFDGLKRPYLVDYVGDYDLWRFALPDSKYISAGIRSWPMDFEIWDDFNEEGESGRMRLRDAGITLVRYQKEVIDLHVKQAYEVDIMGHKVLQVNASTLQSEIAGELAKDRPFGVCFTLRENKLQFSLRSTPDGIDVSEIAKLWGGGGHKHAAGFTREVKSLECYL